MVFQQCRMSRIAKLVFIRFYVLDFESKPRSIIYLKSFKVIKFLLFASTSDQEFTMYKKEITTSLSCEARFSFLEHCIR